MRRPTRPLAIVAVGLLALTAAACGGPAATPTPAPLSVEATEFAYAPAAIEAPAGAATVIQLVNKGTVEHDITIDALNFKVTAQKPGTTAEGTLDKPAAGTYEFYCSIPGHQAAGMVGTLTVK